MWATFSAGADPKGGLGGLQPPYKYDLFIKLELISLKFLLISSLSSMYLLFSRLLLSILDPPLVVCLSRPHAR